MINPSRRTRPGRRATPAGVLPEVGGVDREDEEGAEAASEEDVEGAEGSKGVLELELGVNYKSEAQYGRQCLLPFTCVWGSRIAECSNHPAKSQRKARHRGRHKAVHLSQLPQSSEVASISRAGTTRRCSWTKAADSYCWIQTKLRFRSWDTTLQKDVHLNM